MSHDNMISRMSNKKSYITLHTALKANSGSVVERLHTNHLLLGYGCVTECDLQQLSNLCLHTCAAFLAFLHAFSSLTYETGCV